MIDVLMPQLGESVAEGTVTKWLVREGDYVSRDQTLAEVATDKADTEIPSPANGIVANIAAGEGAVVPKAGLLCRIDETAQKPEGRPAPEPKRAAEAKPEPKPQATQPPPQPESMTNGETAHATALANPPGAPVASPSTRKLAHEMGVDLQRVQATGERGRITRDDVVRALGQPQGSESAPPPPHATSPAAELSQLIQAGGGFVPPIPGVGYGAYKVPAYVQKPGDQVIPFNRRRRITSDHMV